MDMTRPSSGHDQAEDPIKIHHPEEEDHHESRASRMFGKVKARAKKFKNSLTKHGNEHDHNVVEEEEDDENDEPEPEKHVAPVNEVSAVRSYRTSLPESLSHPRETNVPASEEIVPSGTKDSTVVYSSDDNRRVEPEHEAPSYPVRTSDVSEREDGRETHHVPLNTPESLLSAQTEDVTTPGGEDESLGGQREVNTERPKRLEDDLSGESTYHFETRIGKDSPVRFEGESETELGKDLPTRSFEFDEKSQSETRNDSPTGFGGRTETGPVEDYPAKGHDFDQKIESGIGNDSPTRFGRKTETEPRDDFPAKSYEFDQKIESGVDNDLSTGFDGKTETGPREDFPMKSYDFDQKMESGVENDSPTRFGGKPETELREDFPARSHEFEQTIGSEIGKDNGGGEPGTERREDFLGKSYEFDQEIKSAVGKDSPTRLDGESELDESFPARSDDVKVETTGLGRDLPTETNDQFSPEFSGPKERNDFDSKADAQEPKPTTYTEMIGSATSFVTNKAIATKNVVASSLGYSGETAGGKDESPVNVETVAEKLTIDDESVKETASPVTMKLPFSGGGNGAEETEQEEGQGVSTKDYLAEKMTPEEENKAFSEMVAEKLNLGAEERKKTTTTKEVEVAVEEIPSDQLSEEIEHGEAVVEEGKGGGGMVGKIKGVYNYWLGGTTTEEMKPKSPVSVEESSQSLGSSVGTKGFSDSDESGLGETGGSTGAVPVQRGL